MTFQQITIYLAYFLIFFYNSFMRKLVVNQKWNHKYLQNVLQGNFNGLSSSIFFKTLRKKDIKVNGKRITENITVFENDIIEIYLEDQFLFPQIDLISIYEDENILVINKPVGIDVLNSSENNLTKLIQTNYSLGDNFPYPCHRLDRNTCGLILYAKNQKALDILNQKIKEHEILKFYQCTVIGILERKKSTLTDYLFKDSKKSIVYINSTAKPGYKKIITSYEVIDENKQDNLSVLKVQLHTGRTHQIRAHLAYIGHPILGDGKYGINEINKKFKKNTQELCAYQLVFNFQKDAGILNYLNQKEFKI